MEERDEQNKMVPGVQILELLKIFNTNIIDDVMKHIKKCVGVTAGIDPTAPVAVNLPGFSSKFDCQLEMDGERSCSVLFWNYMYIDIGGVTYEVLADS